LIAQFDIKNIFQKSGGFFASGVSMHIGTHVKTLISALFNNPNIKYRHPLWER